MSPRNAAGRGLTSPDPPSIRTSSEHDPSAPRRVSDLTPAGLFLVPVMAALFVKADALEDGDS